MKKWEFIFIFLFVLVLMSLVFLLTALNLVPSCKNQWNFKVKNIVDENGKIVFYCEEKTNPLAMFFKSTEENDHELYWDVRCKIENRIQSGCKSSFDHFTYGEPPEGYYENKNPLPMVHGIKYYISIPAGEGSYWSDFIFDPKNKNVEKGK